MKIMLYKAIPGVQASMLHLFLLIPIKRFSAQKKGIQLYYKNLEKINEMSKLI